ncbi:MAG: hypothetical protein IRZ33_03855 [Alicyclobacillaceae bacterium]|nr:hypothetical protein [Alicyclobacillaceae bacterium]
MRAAHAGKLRDAVRGIRRWATFGRRGGQGGRLQVASGLLLLATAYTVAAWGLQAESSAGSAGRQTPASALWSAVHSWLRLAAGGDAAAAHPSSPVLPGAAATGDVPDAVLGQITGSVGDVDGMDELLVLPGIHQGYDVYATVNLGYGSSLSWPERRKRAEAGAASFFRSVYSSGVNVEDAGISFLWNGQIVAGAGLGADMYRKITVAAGGDSGSDSSSALAADERFVAALASLGDHPQPGAEDAWYEVSGASVNGTKD